MSTKYALDAAINLAKKHKFFQEKIIQIMGNQVMTHSYGTPGALMRKNIMREWESWSRKNQDNIHTVETPITHGQSNDSLSEVSRFNGFYTRQSLKEGLLDQFHSHLWESQSGKSDLPLTVLTAGIILRDDNSGSLSLRSPERHEMLMAYFCSPNLVSQSLDFCIKQRLSWWRQFSVQSSQFLETELCSKGDDTQEAHVAYRFDSMAENIETITSYGEVSVDKNNNGRASMPHLITCRTDLETCLLVFLMDSYTESMKNSYTGSSKQGRQFLQLNSHLAPYHVQVLCSGAKTNDLKTIGQDLHQKLKNHGLSVLDLNTTATLNRCYQRNDELGVPYTLIIKDQAFDDGVVLLRSRDTSIKEQLHITEVVTKLSQYLEFG